MTKEYSEEEFLKVFLGDCLELAENDEQRLRAYSYVYEKTFGTPFLRGFYGVPDDPAACIDIIRRCLEAKKPYEPDTGSAPGDAIW